jgi:arylsulfatase A-like enzyme
MNSLKKSPALILLGLGLANCTQTIEETTPPNILFIMMDDHAQKAISAYGNALIETPNIDRIGNEGVIFTNSFVANSICAPSRAVMLTGKHSHINGMLDNLSTFDGSQLTFPKLLQQAGYHTSMIGKWHLQSEPTGFDYWNILDDQGEYYNPDLIEMGDTVSHQGYATDVITEIAIQTLARRNKEKPFCMVYNHKAPHRSWMPDTTDLYAFEGKEFPLPDNFFDTYEGRKAAEAADMRIRDMYFTWDMKLQPGQYEKESKKGGGPIGFGGVEEIAEGWLARMSPEQRKAWDDYYLPRGNVFTELKLEGDELAKWMYQRYISDYLKCILSVDRNIGKMLDYLEKEGLLDNTLIVYTSDQGFYLGEHGWYDKRFMYEESFRTPLMMRLPGEINPGTRAGELVQNIDYAPTLLDMAGITAPEEMQGRSLRPLWKKEPVDDWRTALYYHYYEYPHGWHSVHKHEGIRTQRYKLINFYDLEEYELFDLQNDPTEMNNLYGAAGYENLTDSLKTELANIRRFYNVK